MAGRVGIVGLFCLGGSGALLGFAGMTAVGVDRYDRFERSRAAVEQRLGETSRGDAVRWAPAKLAEARAAYRSAGALRNAARASFWPLPDLSAADADLHRALRLLAEAHDQALETQREQRRAAQEVIDHAQTESERDRAWMKAIARVAAFRRQSAGAQFALAEARTLFADQEYEKARDRADEALRMAQQSHGQAATLLERYGNPDQVRAWQRIVRDTIEESRTSGGVAIVVWKVDHRLLVYKSGLLVRQYPAELSYNWIERKRRAGDGAVPEGLYRVADKKQGAKTQYHRALLLDYPSESDQMAFARARLTGEFRPSAAIGGLIEIHGEGGRGLDWTGGCVALRNHDIDELFEMARVGTPVALVGASKPLNPGDFAGVWSLGRGIE